MSARPIEKGLILFELRQYARAEKELFAALQDDPDDPLTLSMLALCCANTRKRQQALEWAKKSIAASADFSFAHYALSFAYSRMGHSMSALSAVDEAIRLSPENPDFWGLKSYIHLSRSTSLNRLEPEQALESADQGLRSNPQHDYCMQMRARALLALGRKSEAGVALKAALALSPEEASTHELQAWMALTGGNAMEARRLYEDALRLDPESASARSGMVASLRAQYSAYRVLLNIIGPGGETRVLPQLILGAAPFAVAALHNVDNPICKSISMALILPVVLGALLALFALFLANPFFNLLLRLNPANRSALSDDETLSANLLLVAILATLMSLFLGAIVSVLWYVPALLFVFMMVPIVLIFEFTQGRIRTFFYFYLALDCALAVSGSVMLLNCDALFADRKGASDLFFRLMSISIGGSILMSMAMFGIEGVAYRIDALLRKYR